MRTIVGMLLLAAGTWAAAVTWMPEAPEVALESTTDPLPARDAGGDEPVFDPAIHVSTFYDDFSSYASVEGSAPRLSVDGEGDHDYQINAGNSPKLPWGEYRIAVGAGRNGTNALAVNYHKHPNAGGTGTGAIGYNPGTLTPKSTNPPDGGENPNVAMLSLWIRSSATDGYIDKFINRFDTGTNSCRLIFGLTTYGALPVNVVRPLYWTNRSCGRRTWCPIDPIHTPAGGLNGCLSQDHCAFDDGQDSASGKSDVYLYPANTGANEWDGSVDLRDGEYHRLTIQLTKKPVGFSTGPPNNWRGGGRIEWWWDGHKMGEFLGDDPQRPEYGLVYLPEAGGPERLWNQVGIFSETKNDYIAGPHEWFLDQWRFYKLK